jgi:hypothetical protein
VSKRLPDAVKALLGGAESIPERRLMLLMERAKMPPVHMQVGLVEGRKFRYDLVIGEPFKVAVEVQGGQWIRGRHNRPQGVETDSEKSALAQERGYIVLHVTPAMISDGRAIERIAGALRSRGWEQP